MDTVMVIVEVVIGILVVGSVVVGAIGWLSNILGGSYRDLDTKDPGDDDL